MYKSCQRILLEGPAAAPWANFSSDSKTCATRRAVFRHCSSVMCHETCSFVMRHETCSSVMQSKPVTTSFLLRAGEAAEEVLLLRRSAAVRTFQEHWAAVSGGIEQADSNPFTAALREVSEETGLVHSSDFVLERALPEPLKVEAGTEIYCVHVFLFRVLSDGSKVKLDWEHTASTWTDTATLIDAKEDELFGEKCVPKLCAAFDAVYLSPPMQTLHNYLSEDRSHGAAELVRHTLQEIETYIQDSLAEGAIPLPFGARLTADGFCRHLAQELRHISAVRGSMAPIVNLCDYLTQKLSSLRPAGFAAGEESKEALVTQLLTFTSQWQCWASESTLRMTNAIHHMLASIRSVLVVSRSSAVVTAIQDAAKSRSADDGDPPLAVVIPESRPLCEGIQMAAELSKLHSPNLRISVITDAQICLFVQSVDCVLLGADTLLPDGSCVNKVGSYAAAAAAYNSGIDRIPVYVACTSEKLLRPEKFRTKAIPPYPPAMGVESPDMLEGGQPSILVPYNETWEQRNLNQELQWRRIASIGAYDSVKDVPRNPVDPRAPVSLKIEEMAPKEVISTLHFPDDKKANSAILHLTNARDVSIRNVYFETVPASMISALITEHGMVRPWELMVMAGDLVVPEPDDS